LLILGHICHSEGVEGTRSIFAKARCALKPGGMLLVADFIPDDERRGGGKAHLALLFALNMLVQTESGGTFTRAEYDQWAREAGFDKGSELIETAGPAAVLVYGK